MANTFLFDFLIANIVLTGMLLLLFVLQRIMKNRLSAKARYQMWFFIFPACIIPFLPVRLWNMSTFLSSFASVSPASKAEINAASTAVAKAASSTDWLNDYALDAGTGPFLSLSRVGFLVLICGMAVALAFTCISIYHVHQLKKSCSPVSTSLESILQQSQKICGLTKPIVLRCSPFVPGPVTLGFISPQIILPVEFVSAYKEEALRHVLMHELIHCKRNDMLINYLGGILRIIYWFHPLVHLALQQISRQRELACDAAVLTKLSRAEQISYGHTLLQFTNKNSRKYAYALTGMGGSKKHLKTRIQEIASFQSFSKKQRLVERICLALSCCLLASCLPLLSVSASAANENHTASKGSSEKEDFSSYFQDISGSFVLYDATEDTWSVYNETASSTRISPDSTYKIYSALFALENGIITPDKTEMSWNQETYPFEAWNQDQTLSSAMRNSVNWYFQALDEEMGLATLQTQFQQIGYGNEDVSAGIDRYWMESSLLISPKEQVALLHDFYTNAFSFADENIKAVKDALYLSSSGGTSLYGKTGTGMHDGQDTNGWFIGFAEQSDHTYFFAVNINASQDASGSNAAKIALQILKDKEIYR